MDRKEGFPMKKLFCLLLTGLLLWGLIPFAFAETTEADEPASIQGQTEKLWDFAQSILNRLNETAVEKQLKAWKENGAYVARTEIYILYRDAAPNQLDGEPTYDFDGFGDEVLLDVQRRMPTLASMSLDELRERIYVDHPMSTRVLDIYTASFQDGAEALELAQAFFDALCEVFTAKTNVDTPVMVSIPALLE